MHNIRFRRFSSVLSWHLVILVITILGSLTSNLAYAQATVTPQLVTVLTKQETAFCDAQSLDATASAQLTTPSATIAVPFMPRVLFPNYGTDQNMTPDLCRWNVTSGSLFTGLFTRSTDVVENTSTTSAQAVAIVEPKATGTALPTVIPTVQPTAKPTVKPTIRPTATSTPTPTAKPVAAITAPADLEALFQQHASTHGVSSEIMKKIAQCESGMRPEAVNGPYGGMFQFVSSTWVSNRRAMGKDTNPALRFNASEAIETAAFKMGRDGYGAWPACSRKALASI